MSISYKEAMEQLQAMFSTFERETLKTVLVVNNGNLEKTIEDLLKMSEDVPKTENKPVDDDDNLFANLTPVKMTNNNNDNLFAIDDSSSEDKVENLGIFPQEKPKPSFEENVQQLEETNNDDELARQLQQEEDERLAMAMQQQYLERAQMQNTQSQRKPHPQQANSNNRIQHYQQHQQPQNFYPGQNLSGMLPEYGEEYNEYEEEEENEQESSPSYPTQNANGEKKKKTSFTNKLKSAFGGLFKKKNKNQNASTSESNANPKATQQQYRASEQKSVIQQQNHTKPTENKSKTNIQPQYPQQNYRQQDPRVINGYNNYPGSQQHYRTAHQQNYQQYEENNKAEEPENNFLWKDGDTVEIFNFSHNGGNNYKPGFHQYEGKDDEHPITLADLNKIDFSNGHSKDSNGQKSVPAITSDYFDFE